MNTIKQFRLTLTILAAVTIGLAALLVLGSGLLKTTINPFIAKATFVLLVTGTTAILLGGFLSILHYRMNRKLEHHHQASYRAKQDVAQGARQSSGKIPR